jgi:hypothetical protein
MKRRRSNGSLAEKLRRAWMAEVVSPQIVIVWHNMRQEMRSRLAITATY